MYILWQHLEPCSAQYPFAESHSLQLNSAPAHGHQPKKGRKKKYIYNVRTRKDPKFICFITKPGSPHVIWTDILSYLFLKPFNKDYSPFLSYFY